MGVGIDPKSAIRKQHPIAMDNMHPKTISMSSLEPILTIILPVYNEADSIKESLQRVLATTYAKQIIIVDDGSTDGTAVVLEKWRNNPDVEIIRHVANQGKGAAIRTGLERAKGEYTIIQDGDLEYDPADYPLLIDPLLKGEAQVVYGSRYLDRKRLIEKNRRFIRFGIAVINLCVRWLYGVKLTDEATCYKAFPTDILRRMDLQCERFEFCPEVTAKVCRMGLKIKEVPIHYEARTVQAGKKIRWTDGIVAIKVLWRLRKWRQGHE